MEAVLLVTGASRGIGAIVRMPPAVYDDEGFAWLT